MVIAQAILPGASHKQVTRAFEITRYAVGAMKVGRNGSLHLHSMAVHSSHTFSRSSLDFTMYHFYIC